MQFHFQDIVNEQDSYRFYGEANTDISDTMEFTLAVTYTKSDTHLNAIPTGAATNRTDAGVSSELFRQLPVRHPGRGPDLQSGAIVNGFPLAGAANGVFIRNPFIDDFMTRTGLSAAARRQRGAVYRRELETVRVWRHPRRDQGLTPSASGSCSPPE